MFAKVQSCTVTGLDGALVEVAVAISDGSAAFTIHGLPHATVNESKTRVCSALMSSGCQLPHSCITVTITPADIWHERSAYDVPVAIGILLASGQLNPAIQQSSSLYLGQLGLDGSLHHTCGILPMVALAREKQVRSVFVTAANAREAALIQGVAIYPVETLGQLIAHLNGERLIEPYRADPCLLEQGDQIAYEQDIASVRGQEHVKRALEVAASGGHNIALSGPPGSGRSLLARSLPSLLPRMTLEEALDVTRMYSVNGMLPLDLPLMWQRQIRVLHPPVRQEALVGDARFPLPGEMSLAHRGVLFLDEFPECGQREQEVLRLALEQRVVTLSRGEGTIVYPASFMLIASIRPCPCGFSADPITACTCSARSIARYQKRMHAQLLEHIDLHIEVPRVDYGKLTDKRNVETSAVMRTRVQAARAWQQRRFVGTTCTCNAEIGAPMIRDFCWMDASGEKLLQAAMQQLHLPVRASHHTLRLARTIADLAESELIKANHIAEAIQYRSRMGL